MPRATLMRYATLRCLPPLPSRYFCQSPLMPDAPLRIAWSRRHARCRRRVYAPPLRRQRLLCSFARCLLIRHAMIEVSACRHATPAPAFATLLTALHVTMPSRVLAWMTPADRKRRADFRRRLLFIHC